MRSGGCRCRGGLALWGPARAAAVPTGLWDFSSRRFLAVFLQQWHGDDVLPGPGQHPQRPVCHLRLRHRHGGGQRGHPHQGEIPQDVPGQRRYLSPGAAFGDNIPTFPRGDSLQAVSGWEELCWGSPEPPEPPKSPEPPQLPESPDPRPPEPPEPSACSRLCPGSLGTALPTGCAGVPSCVTASWRRAQGCWGRGGSPLAALQQL